MKFDLRVRSFRRLKIDRNDETFDSNGTLEDVLELDPKKTTQKRLRFAEEFNQEYQRKEPLTEAEISKRWYSEKDVLRFEYRTIQLLGEWLEKSRAARSLQRIYQGFHELESEPDDLQELIKSQRRVRLKEEEIGLEMILLYGLPSQSHEKTPKRRQILKHIAYYQKKNVISANRAKDMAVAVSATSKPSVQYANYTAVKAYNI